MVALVAVAADVAAYTGRDHGQVCQAGLALAMVVTAAVPVATGMSTAEVEAPAVTPWRVHEEQADVRGELRDLRVALEAEQRSRHLLVEASRREARCCSTTTTTTTTTMR